MKLRFHWKLIASNVKAPAPQSPRGKLRPVNAQTCYLSAPMPRRKQHPASGYMANQQFMATCHQSAPCIRDFPERGARGQICPLNKKYFSTTRTNLTRPVCQSGTCAKPAPRNCGPKNRLPAQRRNSADRNVLCLGISLQNREVPRWLWRNGAPVWYELLSNAPDTRVHFMAGSWAGHSRRCRVLRIWPIVSGRPRMVSMLRDHGPARRCGVRADMGRLFRGR